MATTKRIWIGVTIMPAGGVREARLGPASEALRRLSDRANSDDSMTVRRELEEAPARYKQAITSIYKDDVFKTISPQFPTLLQMANEHRMGVAQFLNELDLVLSMGDIRDPESNVYVYALQVLEPVDLRDRLDKATLETFGPQNSLTELENGYARHEILYDMLDLHRNILLGSLLKHAKKVRVSLKPPWSSHKVDSTVVLA
jgi:hypothetical protein